jgi:hypothetical protein
MKRNKKLTPTSPQQTEATAEVIKLGIDIHKTGGAPWLGQSLPFSPLND